MDAIYLLPLRALTPHSLVRNGMPHIAVVDKFITFAAVTNAIRVFVDSPCNQDGFDTLLS